MNNEEYERRIIKTESMYDFFKEEACMLSDENKELKEKVEKLTLIHEIQTQRIQQLMKRLEKRTNRINKALEYIKKHKRKDEFLNLNEWETRDLEEILKRK